MTSMERFYQLTCRPILTEKGSDDMGKRNAYHFRVPTDANKIEIRHAIETLFDVKVTRVNTMLRPGKLRRRGASWYRTPSRKIAIIQLQDGDKIELL